MPRASEFERSFARLGGLVRCFLPRQSATISQLLRFNLHFQDTFNVPEHVGDSGDMQQTPIASLAVSTSRFY
jgi:hypothetical protein